MDLKSNDRKPFCMVCNMVGLGHCSDPVNCGQLYWPDHMYRELESRALDRDEVNLVVLSIATTVTFYDSNPDIRVDPEVVEALKRLFHKLMRNGMSKRRIDPSIFETLETVLRRRGEPGSPDAVGRAEERMKSEEKQKGDSEHDRDPD